jgi:hypothetical protein
VYGTVVNYVMGLEATEANKALLAALRPGDELLLRMSTGPAYRFAFADAVRVAPQASEVFRQTRPGLTLALMGEQAQASRVVIRAVYLPDSELSGAAAPAAQTVTAGRAATLDGALRLTYLEAIPFALPTTPPGYVYLAVDYTVENALGQALLTTNFMRQVVDADGLSYPAIQMAGGGPASYPPLPAQLEAGQAMTTTDVYAVPEAALRAGLAWRFAPSPSGMTVQATIAPYTGPLQPQVTIKQALCQPDGSLAVTLSLAASGLREAQVTAADIQVQGGRLGVANAFPWQVAAGKSSDFTLSLAPDGQLVTIALGGQGFEFSLE